MKLLMCLKCDSVFKLNLTLRTCECGDVKGMYVNDQDAVVNGNGISLAIGNGSLFQAVQAAMQDPPDWREDSSWREWWDKRPGKNLFLAWARPHGGEANSHTTVNPNL